MTVTAADVADWGKLQIEEESTDEALLERVVAAVTEHVAEYYQVDEPMTATQELAIMMQGSRLWRRRDTPEGIVGLDDAAGVIRVTSLDRDVEALLRPKWGFA